ncbi:MAG: hypothetical protein HYX76_05175 [Acidobacteria bacterium]|nr:hypothetical protein [Acidobacteriota bacterium]
MLLGEFGVDAFHATALANPAPGTINEAEQAAWDLALWRDLRRNLSAVGSSGTAAGGAVFEWNDEWWKVQPHGSQETNGWFSGGFPDGMGNEEYFGITDVDRVPREVYGVLTEAFDPAYAPPPEPVAFSAISKGSCGHAEFRKGNTRLHRDVGCKLNGARGFNVAVVDATTGDPLEPVVSFDTWLTRTSGEDMREVIDYLNGLPDGVLVMIAVGDEAGLTNFDSCTRLNYAWVDEGYLALEALGSTQIRGYCYRNSWAMIAIKGQGVALAEQLGGTGVEVTAQTISNLP